MLIHQVYALISNEEVMNICVCDNYEFANIIARETYGINAFAVDCLQYRCSVGDTYKDGTFYHTDEETGETTVVGYSPTAEQQVEYLAEENALLTEDLTVTQLALVEQYEEKVALQDEIESIKSALSAVTDKVGALEALINL